MSAHEFKTRKEQITTKALECRRDGQFIDIDWCLPSVMIRRNLGPRGTLYWRDKAAQTLLTEYGAKAKEIDVSVKDLLLALAQEW